MSQDTPLISVIVPVYKVERYLDQCVDSIVNQTYKNLEIILVDDGSPDRCPEMCEDWAKKDSRIKVIHKENGGLGDARNAGVAVASGDYLGFVDSDDWCEKEMYQELLEVCQKFDAPVSVGNVFVDWECGWPTEKTVFAKENRCQDRSEVLRNFFGDKLTAWAWNKIYKREMLPFLDYPRQNYEDIPVARKIFNEAKKIAFTSKFLYHYRQRQGSIVNSNVNPSQIVFIEELRKNVEMAKTLGFEKEAVARLSMSSFNFLEKICAKPSPEFQDEIPKLIRDICSGKPYIGMMSIRKLDKMFIWFLSKKVPCKAVFGVRRLLQWFYWKLNLKKV